MLNDADLKSIGRMHIFQGLAANQLAQLGKSSTARSVEKGEEIFRQHDDAQHFFGVLDGWVKVQRLSNAGEAAVLGLFGKGETFAEAAMFLGRSYPASAEAVEASRICIFSAEAFLALADASPSALFGMLGSISLHLHEMTLQVEQLKTRNAKQRVGLFLLRISGKKSGADKVNLPYDKSLIAARLGMTPESLSRNLSALRDVGVTVSNQAVAIRDCDRLARYCTSSPLRARLA